MSENISVKLPAADGFDPSNNRAELYAVILAVNQIMMLYDPCEIVIKTDSKLVLGTATEWLPNWKKRGWKNSKKKPISNVDLVKQLDDTLERAKKKGYPITFEHVKAHQKAPRDTSSEAYMDWYGNAQADYLATHFVD